MEVNLNEMSPTRAAPKSSPQTKNNTSSASDDKSFQDSLDNKVQTSRENKKAADDQQNNAIANATPVYTTTTAQATTPTTTVPVSEAEQEIAFALEVVKMQGNTTQANAAQQALEKMSSAMQQMEQNDPQTQVNVMDLMEQIQAATSQTPSDQGNIKIDFQLNNQSSLQLLAQQETGSKVAADLNSVKTENKPTTASTNDLVLPVTQKTSQNSDNNTEKTTAASQLFSVKPNILEQINTLQKQSDDSISSQILNQVNDKLKTALDSGKDTIRIQLQPENLGKVDVRIVRGNDSVQFYFTADNQTTSKMLQSTMNQLQQSLTDAGVKVGNMSVSYQGQPGQQNNQGQSQKKNGFSFFGQDDGEFIPDYTSQSALSALDARA